MDIERIRELAESADRRAKDAHAEYELSRRDARMAGQTGDERKAHFRKAQSYLNDFFYWTGYKNAYMGIIAAEEINRIVEAELDAEPTCP